MKFFTARSRGKLDCHWIVEDQQWNPHTLAFFESTVLVDWCLGALFLRPLYGPMIPPHVRHYLRFYGGLRLQQVIVVQDAQHLFSEHVITLHLRSPLSEVHRIVWVPRTWGRIYHVQPSELQVDSRSHRDQTPLREQQAPYQLGICNYVDHKQ